MAREYVEFNPTSLIVGQTSTAEIRASNGSGSSYQWFFKVEMTLNSQSSGKSNVTIKVALRNASSGTYWSGVPLNGVGGVRLYNNEELLHDGGQVVYTSYNGSYSYTGSTSYRYSLHNTPICEWTGDVLNSKLPLKVEYYINTGYVSTTYGCSPFTKLFNEVTFPFTSNGSAYVKVNGQQKKGTPYIKISGSWRKGTSYVKETTWHIGN